MKPIWIVDDDPSIRFVLEKALGREGWATRSFIQARDVLTALSDVDADRKSTRLNSSHLVISYAVFCLKKKKKIKNHYCYTPAYRTTCHVSAICVIDSHRDSLS